MAGTDFHDETYKAEMYVNLIPLNIKCMRARFFPAKLPPFL